LQRAFHLAGCRKVIASLWKVEDDATAALMILFYRNLLEKKLDPADALRQAQLTLYRHPEAVTIVQKRGSDFTESELPQVKPRTPRVAAQTPLLEGNLLIVCIGGKPGACVLALDKTRRGIPHGLS
jgi:hypothetical protein